MILWLLLVCVGGNFAAKGFLKLRENPSELGRKILKQAYLKIEEDAIWWCLPGSFYDEKDSQSLVDIICGKIGSFFPLFTYLEQNQEILTVVEDESTYHKIIEVNGKTITERILAENQGTAVEEENQAAREDRAKDKADVSEEAGEQDEVQMQADASGEAQPGDEQQGQTTAQENTTLPAWTQAVENAASKDLSMERLSDFDYLLNNFFVVDPNTTIDSSQMNAAALMQDDLKIEGQSENPQILIYHTHSQEGYADSIEGDENTSVIGVGNYLESLLRDVFGYKVIHIKDAFDMMDGQLERSKAYNYALPRVQQVLDENPSIEVVIDLHRDGVPDDKHLVTEINGKPTAQIMFFNGLSKTINNGSLDSLPNPYIADNLAFSFQLSYQAARFYPQFTRCIYLKGYRYNLHVRPRSILLEVGAQTNTVQEAMNAMEPFSVILNKVLKGE
ncbi:MAG: stage II sporulation protein P [Clostridia bacterium]|nr:stage II sporulation protein P [Clostridia bacterium]NCC43427.1 stage II sporulation protein P [Clostridia bacterium]